MAHTALRQGEAEDPYALGSPAQMGKYQKYFHGAIDREKAAALLRQAGLLTGYGNFDIIMTHHHDPPFFTGICQLHATPRARWATLYLVPMLIGC